MEAEATLKSKSWLKRFSHQRRFQVAVELMRLNGNERILDYGAGEGFLFDYILDRHAECHLVGYEPYPPEYAKLVDRIGGGGQTSSHRQPGCARNALVRCHLLLGSI